MVTKGHTVMVVLDGGVGGAQVTDNKDTANDLPKLGKVRYTHITPGTLATFPFIRGSLASHVCSFVQTPYNIENVAQIYEVMRGNISVYMR